MLKQKELEASINLIDVLLDTRTKLDEDVKESIILLLNIVGNIIVKKKENKQ